jgi:hypothetical protein
MNGIREILELNHMRAEEDFDEFEEMMNLQLVRQLEVFDRRADHIIVLNHTEFKRTFRFTEAGVYALVDMLFEQLNFESNRGRPLTVLQQVLVALNHYAGGHFQRTTGLCAGISQPTACRVSERVSFAVCQHKGRFLHFDRG